MEHGRGGMRKRARVARTCAYIRGACCAPRWLLLELPSAILLMTRLYFSRFHLFYPRRASALRTRRWCEYVLIASRHNHSAAYGILWPLFGYNASPCLACGTWIVAYCPSSASAYEGAPAACSRRASTYGDTTCLLPRATLCSAIPYHA